jgi:cobalt-zinc-cadmium efflux system protein
MSAEIWCAYEHRPIPPFEPEAHTHHSDPCASAHRPDQRRALAVCLLLTLLMMTVEFATGAWYGSLMLVSDAVHMLSHVSALAVSWIAFKIAGQSAGKGLSYGLYRIEILAALINGVVLAAFSLWILFKAIGRVFDPMAISSAEVTGVAIAGLVVNVATALLLQRSGAWDLNTRSALLHMLADLISSVAIVVGGATIWLTGWTLLDPLLSIVIAVIVVKWSFDLLRASALVLLESQPAHLSQDQVEAALMEGFPQIKELHDLHVWEITSQFVCLSVHVVVEDTSLSNAQRLRRRISGFLRKRYGIGHTVIQMEC